MILDNTNFLIVGLGLIGGSYAKALKEKGYRVSAIDTNKESIKYALDNNIIDKGSFFDDEKLISEADFIILGLYPSLELDWVKENQKNFKTGVIISDVAGVKGCIVGKIQEVLRSDAEFIACHPMAGKEVSGVQNSDPSIFEKANYIIVPTDKNSKEIIEDAKTLGSIIGFNKISMLSVEKHDEIIGFVSQLTHVIAISLMTCNEDEHLENYTGDSFRDLTRIARINEKMWAELFLENKEELLEQIDAFDRQLCNIRKLIENEDRSTLEDVMKKSTSRRALFDKK